MPLNEVDRVRNSAQGQMGITALRFGVLSETFNPTKSILTTGEERKIVGELTALRANITASTDETQRQKHLGEYQKLRDFFSFCNIGLVGICIANKYNHGAVYGCLSQEDLFQEGYFGLQAAIDGYEDRGKKFSTYAITSIDRAIRRAIDTQAATIRKPTSFWGQQRKVGAIIAGYLGKNGEEPKIEEIAKATGLSKKRVGEIMLNAKNTASLNQLVSDDPDSQEKQFFEVDRTSIGRNPSAIVIKMEDSASLNAALSILPEEERQAVELRFGLSGPVRTFEQVGERQGVSRSTAYNRVEAGLDKLKKKPSCKEGKRPSPVTFTRNSEPAEEQKKRNWPNIIAQGLGITEEEAQRIITRNNKLPVGEYVAEEDQWVYPRFNANTSLLAHASPGFYGPRGLRPSLVSEINLFEISGIPANSTNYKKFRKALDRISDYLLELGLTASSPDDHISDGISFNGHDIRRGIYIPRGVDRKAAQALGVAFADGSLGVGQNGLSLWTESKNAEFYDSSVRKAFEEGFNFSSDTPVKKTEFQTEKSSDGYSKLKISYASLALINYLKGLGFPIDRAARSEIGLPEAIKSAEKDTAYDFLRFFLGAKVSVHMSWGSLEVGSGAFGKHYLEDVLDILQAQTKTRFLELGLSRREKPRIFIWRETAIELMLLGLLDTNPRIKREMDQFFIKHLGPRIKYRLEKLYPDEMKRKMEELKLIRD
jgi:RNA polymerase sigma factor (sigma-70 family)